MSDKPKCGLCGEPMPDGEEMFKYHGYSGSCPKPHLPPPAWHDEHVAYLRFTRGTIVVCDSDAEGAFKVFKTNTVNEQREAGRNAALAESKQREQAAVEAERDRCLDKLWSMRDCSEDDGNIERAKTIDTAMLLLRSIGPTPALDALLAEARLHEAEEWFNKFTSDIHDEIVTNYGKEKCACWGCCRLAKLRAKD